jgi:hypothetical protein
LLRVPRNPHHEQRWLSTEAFGLLVRIVNGCASGVCIVPPWMWAVFREVVIFPLVLPRSADEDKTFGLGVKPGLIVGNTRKYQ